MCRTKKVIDVSDEEEFVFLDTVHTEIAVIDGGTKPWTIDIQLNGDLTEFKIDTGADVTVIPATMYKEPRDKRLQPAGKILQGPSKYTLSVLGKFQGTLQSANATVTENISKEPTDWCAGMVVIPKSGGIVRICLYLTKLNQNVQRECLMLPSVEQTLAQLGGATVFSKLDANSGFLAGGTDKRIITDDYIYNSIWTVPIQSTPFRDSISS